MMDINFQLRFQTIMALIHILENMERETMLLILMGIISTPLIFSSLWSIGWTLLLQMFYLGLQTGLVLFIVSAVYFGLLKAAAVTYPKFARGSCTLGDILLSMIFHCGLWIPSSVWEVITQYFGIGPVNSSAKGVSSRVSFADPESTTMMFDVTPPSPISRPDDDQDVLRRITRSSPKKEIYTLPSLLVPDTTASPAGTAVENGPRQRRNPTRKQDAHHRRKRLVYNDNGDE